MSGTSEGALRRRARQVGLSVSEYIDMLNKGMAWCYLDQAWEPASEFGRDASRSDGRARSCRRSKNAAARRAYQSSARPKVSAGCNNCYAIRTTHRMTANPNPLVSQAYAGTEAGGEWTGKVNLLAERLDQPLRWRKPRRIFVNAQSDLFHKDVPDEFIARVWQAMGAAPHHTYQVLTKRHARMRSWVRRWYAGDVAEPERWAAVPGFPGYRVSTRGVIIGKRSDTANGLRAEVGEHGHLRVTLHRDGSPRSGERLLVHRVVLEAFTRSARPGEQARHLNGDASDNRLSNLRWGTQRENWNDRRAQGNGRSYAKLSESDVCEIRRRLGAGEAAYSIAADFPVSDTQIRNIARGDQWAPVEAVTYQPGERAVLDCVWLGVSVEDQATADLRIPALLDTPAAVRWISAEPLLGSVDLRDYVDRWHEDDDRTCDWGHCDRAAVAVRRDFMHEDPRYLSMLPVCELHRGIDWVVVGGESGPGARPMHPHWARSLRDQCAAIGVPYFFKQWGEWAPTNEHPGRHGAPLRDDHCLLHLAGMTARTKSNPFDPIGRGHPGWNQPMRRVGRRASGDLLDGAQHHEWPQTERTER